jgi:protein O-GlcNAc transferase
MDPIREMVSSKQMYAIVNGVQLRNGVLFNPSHKKTATGEEVPQDIVVTTRQQYELPDNAIVFCNFQQLFKINPTIFKTWMNVS